MKKNIVMLSLLGMVAGFIVIPTAFVFAKSKKNLVAIGGSISEVVVALGHEKSLLAVDASSVYPSSLRKLPKVGYWLKLSQEGILSLKPSIVVASEMSKPKEVLEGLKNFGVKTYFIDDKPTFASVKKKIKQVGEILHEEKKAEQVIQRLNTNVTQMEKEIKQNKKSNKKVLFLFYRSDEKMMAVGNNSAASTLIELSGAKNAVDFSNYRILAPEALAKLNPDIIIVGDIEGNEFDTNNIKNKAILLTQAAKNKQIYRVDMLLASGFSTRFDSALEKFSCFIHENTLSYCKK